MRRGTDKAHLGADKADLGAGVLEVCGESVDGLAELLLLSQRGLVKRTLLSQRGLQLVHRAGQLLALRQPTQLLARRQLRLLRGASENAMRGETTVSTKQPRQ